MAESSDEFPGDELTIGRPAVARESLLDDCSLNVLQVSIIAASRRRAACIAAGGAAFV